MVVGRGTVAYAATSLDAVPYRAGCQLRGGPGNVGNRRSRAECPVRKTASRIRIEREPGRIGFCSRAARLSSWRAGVGKPQLASSGLQGGRGHQRGVTPRRWDALRRTFRVMAATRQGSRGAPSNWRARPKRSSTNWRFLAGSWRSPSLRSAREIGAFFVVCRK